MMQKMLAGVVVTLGLLGFRCSDEPTRTEEKVPEAPAMITLNGPLSPNAPPQIAQKALEVDGYFDFVSATLDDLEGKDPAINSNIYTWEISLGSGSVVKKIKAVRRSDASIDWTAVLNGTAADSTIYSDRTLFIGKAASTLQSWTFFDLLSGAASHKISWSKDKNGTIQLDDSITATGELWQLTNKSSGAGSYSYKSGSVLKFSATWSADGSGSYHDYTVPGSADVTWN
jgi:hypothetical protein